MSFAEPKNIGLLQQLPQGAQDQYNRLHAAMEAVDKKSPDRDKPVFTKFLNDSIEDLGRQNQFYQSTLDRAHQGNIPVNGKKLQDKSIAAHQQFVANFASNVAPQFGADGQKDFNDLGKEMNKTMASDVIGNVYDEEKGFKWSGIIGGLLGGLLLNTLSGGAGGWFGWLMIAVGAIVGSWIGSQTGDAIGNRLGKDETSKQPAAGQGKAKAFDPVAQKRRESAEALAAKLEEEKKAAEKHGLSGGENIEDKHGAQLPGQPTPSKQPTDKAKTSQPDTP